MKQKIHRSRHYIIRQQKKFAKMGDKYIYIIPKQVVDAGILEFGKEYVFIIKEVE